MEMHKVKIVQKLNLLPVRDRLARMEEAGFNTFQLHNGDIFMDMLTDSGVNAMSDNQLAAMMTPDDAYAGSESFYRMVDKLEACIEKEGAENVVFMRLESGTNLSGGPCTYVRGVPYIRRNKRHGERNPLRREKP
jgi:tryptophanase